MMKVIKRFILGLIWEISLWCLERIFMMLDWVEPMYAEVCKEEWERK